MILDSHIISTGCNVALGKQIRILFCQNSIKHRKEPFQTFQYHIRFQTKRKLLLDFELLTNDRTLLLKENLETPKSKRIFNMTP